MSSNSSTHACTHTCMHTHTHAHTHMHAHAHTHTHAHKHTHTYAHTHMHAHAHTHTCTQTHTHTYIYAHTHMHALAHTHAYTHTHACTHTRMHTRTHACTRACTRALTHTHTHFIKDVIWCHKDRETAKMKPTEHFKRRLWISSFCVLFQIGQPSLTEWFEKEASCWRPCSWSLGSFAALWLCVCFSVTCACSKGSAPSPYRLAASVLPVDCRNASLWEWKLISF